MDEDSANPASLERGLFLVLEYVEGGSLWDLLLKQMSSRQRRYTMQDSVRILIGVARGLQYLHERQPTVRWG